MAAKTDYLSQPEPYLYHPPFYFHLLAEWFSLVDPGVNQAHLLAVAGSALTMLLLLSLLRRVIGDRWALVGVGIVALDMWLNFSQRVGWIENTLIPIGVLGVRLYVAAIDKARWWMYSLAGFVLGFAAIYKHIGVIFIGVVIVHAIIFRKDWRMNLVTLASSGVVACVYVAAASAVFSSVFTQVSLVQLLRSVGEQDSAGALSSLGDAVAPLVGQYSIYVATVALAAVGVALVLFRLAQIILKRGKIDKVESIGILYSWALTATVFFVVLQLRFPHYAMHAFIPLFCYVVAEVSRIAPSRRKSIAVVVLGVAVLAANTFAFNARYIAPERDSALRDIQEFATEHIPADAKVIADESTGTVIPQPYCIMWKGAGCTGATYIIVYTSSTQHVQNNSGQEELIRSGTEVFVTTGYKEKIVVYELSSPVP